MTQFPHVNPLSQGMEPDVPHEKFVEPQSH